MGHEAGRCGACILIGRWCSRGGTRHCWTYAHSRRPSAGAGTLTATAFLAGLKAGHAFVTHGPLVFADHLFGSQVAPGTAIRFTLEAAAGLERATVIVDGKPRKTVDYHGEETARLTVHAAGGWDALIVSDKTGNTAYTNPIWTQLRAMSPRAPAHRAHNPSPARRSD